ncbi:MAG: hypothetical protein QME68_08455, partial [Elusimicrobiota bacterium]|nr:hypothetical protein [Elusimicrobiota bacterium]
MQTEIKPSRADIAKLVEKYRDIGIDTSRVNKDLENSIKDAEYITNMISLYSEIGKLVQEGKSVKEIVKAVSLQTVWAYLSSRPEAISEDQLKTEIEQLVNNRKSTQYFIKLAEVTEKLYKQSNAFKGSIKIGNKTVKLSDSWQFGDKTLIDEILNLKVEENIERLKEKVDSENKTKVDLKQLVAKAVLEFERKYGKLFSKQEMIEHIWNGVGAYGLQAGRDYYVKDGRVVVMNLGRGVDNLSLPAGMMQVLEAKHNVDISRPNVETYISNSVFAMSLFKDIVGLTGTASNAIDKSVLSRMGFEKNGTAGKVESHWRLSQTQKGTVEFIQCAVQEMNNKGIANFNLIVTPDSAISKFAYELLLSLGVSESDIKYVGADVTDKELDVLRDEVSEGKYKFVIADAYLLGRGWNVGNMLNAAKTFKQTQNAT